MKHVFQSLLVMGFACSLTLLPSNALGQTGPPAISRTEHESLQMRVVVLPFKNITRQPEDEWLGESFSESLTMALTRTDHLQLIERNQIQAILQEQSFTQSVFADSDSAPELGKLLGAQKILLGNYQHIGDTLVVNTRMVDVESGQVDQRVATQVRGASNQVLEIQAQLSRVLIDSLQTQWPQNKPHEEIVLTQSNTAYANYHKALQLSRLGSDQTLKQAVVLLGQALQQDPNFALAHVALSELLSTRAMEPVAYPSFQNNDLEQAIVHANRALDLNANLGSVYRALANAYYAQGARQKSQATIELALQQLPGDTDTVLAYLRLQDDKPVQEVHRRLRDLRVNLSDPWIQFSLGTHYLDAVKNDLEPDLTIAFDLLNSAQKALPDHALILLKLSEIKVLQKDYQAAESLSKQALQLDKNNYLLYFMAAQTLMYGPNQTVIQQWLEESVRLNPNFGYNLMTLGYVHWRNERMDTALNLLKQAASIFPESAAMAFVQGKYYYAKGEYEQARVYLLQALDMYGQSPVERISAGAIYLKLGLIEMHAGRLDEALKYYQQATQTERSIKALAYLKMSQVQASQIQYADALNSFKNYLELSAYRNQETVQRDRQSLYLLEQAKMQPDNPALLNDMGLQALRDHDYRLAAEYFEQALAPAENPSIRYNYGLLRLYQHQWPEAVKEFERVLQVNPDHHKARYNLGLAWLKSGDVTQAKLSWQALLKRQPEHERARASLAELATK